MQILKKFIQLKKKISKKLKEALYTVLINACTSNNLEKEKSKKIYDKSDLKMFGKNITDIYFKKRIESKIYEEIEQKILEEYAGIFKKNLLLYFDELILKNKEISNFFTRQGEENANSIFNKIRSSICYEKDDLTTLLEKENKIKNKKNKKEDKNNNINNDSDEDIDDEDYENNVIELDLDK